MEYKRLFLGGLGVLLLLAFSCVKSSPAAKVEEIKEVAERPLKVVFMANGVLGDVSFFDSANRGMRLLKEKYGDKIEVKTVEATIDDTKWQPALEDLSEQDWDVIIVGTFTIVGILEQVAAAYPEKHYVIFDGIVDTSVKNVHSMVYKQNEVAFLAGALAAKMTSVSSDAIINEEKEIGFLGGMEIPVIDDFLVGYIEGAKYADPDIKVRIAYTGSFDDSAKGKELALLQYRQGVDIGFNVAGAAGLGQLDAAKEMNKYAIGVDSDQAQLFSASDPEKSNLILTSVLKRVDNSIVRAIDKHLAGTLPYGDVEFLGFAEKAIGLVEEGNFARIVPPELRDYISQVQADLSSGKIQVSTAFGMSASDLSAIKESVQ